MAVNAPIQGTQSDIIKLAMVEADALIEKKGWRGAVELVLQVHDELVYEIDEKIAEEAATAIRHVMESVAPTSSRMCQLLPGRDREKLSIMTKLPR